MSEEGYKVTQRFIDSGRGVLFGHDTVCLNFNHLNFYKFQDQLGIVVRYNTTGWTSTSVAVINRGTLTSFPWTLRGTLDIPSCHSYGQYVGGTLEGTEWMTLNASRLYDEETGAHSNFYLVTNNNLAMIQTGHSNGRATDDERKVLANTLFYLHQTSQVTTAKDNSFYDISAPDAPSADIIDVDDGSVRYDIYSEDNGTKYQYYIEAVSSTDDETDNIQSNILSETALSGINGYVYVVNDSPDKDSSIISIDDDSDKVMNVVGADKNGHLEVSVNISDVEEGKYLHIYAIDNENNVSDETIIRLENGILSTNIATDKDRYINNESVDIESCTTAIPVSAKGDVSISLYNDEGTFIRELYYDNKQTVNNKDPLIIETVMELDESYDGDYSINIEWTEKGNTICAASTVFTVYDDNQSIDNARPDESKQGNTNNTGVDNIMRIPQNSIDDPASSQDNKLDIEGDEGITELRDSKDQASTPNTGDDFNVLGFVIIKLLSLLVIALIIWRIRKSSIEK